MPPKRKADPKQHSLEEVVEKPASTKKVRKGKLAAATVEENDTSTEELVKSKIARKHQNDPAFKAKKAEEKKQENTSKSSDEEKPDFIEINRAPVLTAWVTAVARRQGLSRDAGLTFGKAISGMLAQSKGRSIGVFKETEKDGQADEEKKQHEEDDGIEYAEVFGMKVKAVKVEGELRALESGSKTAVDPIKVAQYLNRAFSRRLGAAEAVLKELADSYPPDQIGSEAYHLYEQFRPTVAQGKQGWGAKGRLEFDRIRELKASS